MSDVRERIQVFDPKQEVLVVHRRLPHWAQAGTICYITFRTDDSLPKPVMERWLRERNAFLRLHQIDPFALGWRQRLEELDPKIKNAFDRDFSEKWHDNLDNCHGACVLRRPELGKIVAESLQKFDGERYELTDFIVMPNHAHVLAAFPDEKSMLAQCESWKHYTAGKINRALGQRRRFWQQDGFDHLVRSPEQFEYLRRYIADNSQKAKLRPGEFIHYSKAM
ncbi:MAG: transposase [Planctomycetota bacterium]|nr:transposase [Planctomycetota bacterium]